MQFEILQQDEEKKQSYTSTGDVRNLIISMNYKPMEQRVKEEPRRQ